MTIAGRKESYGTEDTDYWRTDGFGGEPPRRGYGAVGGARGGIAGADQAAGTPCGGLWQHFGEAAGRDAVWREARQVHRGDRRRLQGFGRSGAEIVRRRLSAAGAGRGPFDRSGIDQRSGGAF